MMRRRVTLQNKSIRRVNYTCPNCGSDMLQNTELKGLDKLYGYGDNLSFDAYDEWVSSKQVIIALKCRTCGYEWTVLSRL